MEEKPKRLLCLECRGTGLDKSLPRRYTTGGHNDRSCPRCRGECYIDVERDERKHDREPDQVVLWGLYVIALFDLLRLTFFFIWPMLAVNWLASVRRRTRFALAELLFFVAFVGLVIAVLLAGPYSAE